MAMIRGSGDHAIAGILFQERGATPFAGGSNGRKGRDTDREASLPFSGTWFFAGRHDSSRNSYALRGLTAEERE